MTAPEQVALELFPEGGLLLEIDSGLFYKLNGTAAFVWGRTLAGLAPADVVQALVDTFAVSKTVATRDVAFALELPRTSFPPVAAELQYAKRGDTYLFSTADQQLFELTSDGTRLRVLADIPPAQLGPYLRAVSPKLLSLAGISVLHAGAVLRPDGRVLAFLGESGAGKTTTAHAFAKGGGRVIAEDKLMLARSSAADLTVVDGEARITDWIKTMRTRLAALPQSGGWCDATGLEQLADGPTATLATIVLLSAMRRRGDELTLRRLPPLDAAGEIFRNGFYGSTAPEDWRRGFGRACALARVTAVCEATMPQGNDALQAAAGRYIDTMAS